MKFTAIIVALATVAFADHDMTVSTDVARDATVAYNGFQNSDGTFDALVPKGLKDTLVTFKGNRDYERVLLGFDMPKMIKDPSQITNCVLHVPTPKDAPTTSYTLTAFTASSNWDEATVNAQTQITSIRMLGSVSVSGNGDKPGDIDITGACQAAAEGKFSLLLDTSGPLVSFNSLQAGMDMFSVDITY
ncbi:hypothetical protein FBU59_003007 [Linderina macrospora]|uniref:Uncharacterized protein n=1 Tax=Linderina macrospora TaxID=4868 RepID=A0ACC1J9G7_9FUNG|nr:hypothetical protein FBU59_003007 [Linderina macrospora]